MVGIPQLNQAMAFDQEWRHKLQMGVQEICERNEQKQIPPILSYGVSLKQFRMTFP